jgi:phosphatidylinositol alpha 1,6-mannosyltransferase
MKPIRTALFACAYSEVDGVATTVHNFERYARDRNLPLLVIHGSDHNRDSCNGTVRRVEFRRKFPKFAVDKKHDFDLLFWRYYEKAKAVLGEFQPDLIHVTGPSDVGMLGALLAHRLSIPLAASWHTNLHEYAEQRAMPILRFLPNNLKKALGRNIRKLSLKALARYYHIPRLLFAPNPELMELLQKLTRKKFCLMSRGVDVGLFSPDRRLRRAGLFTIGYVGRITAEKNIEMLVHLEQDLLKANMSHFRFLIVGQGSSVSWLRENLRHADFAGVLHGERLAETYANMDAFVFPSRTDTFGNVVLEALASGVPAIVTNDGGPKFIVRHGITGFVANHRRHFALSVIELMNHPEKHRFMRLAARDYALKQSWDAVFDNLYQKYDLMLASVSAKSSRSLTVQPDLSTAGAAL